MARFYILLCSLFLFLSGPAYGQGKNAVPDITDILRQVYTNNPTLKAAREELLATRELYPQARAGWLPSINAETSIFTSDIENSNFSAGSGATTKDITLSVDQPIWRGGRTFSETARAEALIKTGETILKQIEQDVFLEALTAYMNVLRDRELLNLRLHNEGILREELEASYQRKKYGEITNTDIQQARSRLSRAKSASITAKTNLEVSNAKFQRITGLTPPKKLMVPYIQFSFPNTLDDMLLLAEKRNPEIWIAKYEHRAAGHNSESTFRELMPQLSAFASHNKQYDPQPGTVNESQTQIVGLRATLALYQGGGTRSRIREARRAEKKRQHQIDEIRQRIKQEIASNKHSFLAAQTTTEIRKEEIESAEKALKGVREESTIGQRTVLDILDADQEVINAKIALSQARHDEIVAKFSLAASLGLLNISQLKL